MEDVNYVEGEYGNGALIKDIVQIAVIVNKMNEEFKILASEITEMIAVEYLHNQKSDFKKVVSIIYQVNHSLSSKCCFNPIEIWDKYKHAYKMRYDNKSFKKWNNLILKK